VATAAAGGVVLAALGGSAFCDASTIRHDRADQDYRTHAAEPQFDPVGRYSAGAVFGSFTLIAPQWALTAAHVVDSNLNGDLSDDSITGDSLTVGGVTRHATQAVVPVGIGSNRGWNGNINDGFDIALVHLDQPVTTVVPATLYTSFQELGQTITSVGFGQSGTGKTGAVGASGTKRAVDNVADLFVTFSNGATALRYDFDEPAPRISPNNSGSTTPLDLEGLIAPGDSGGGVFIFDNDGWQLAGVNSGTYPFFSYPDATSDTSTYGDAALFTRVAAYQDFILGNIPELAVSIPEPTHAGLLAAVATLVAHRRRRRTPAA
jgi:secreted trypsin-like serine protease